MTLSILKTLFRARYRLEADTGGMNQRAIERLVRLEMALDAGE
jgi:hypothetical protein